LYPSTYWDIVDIVAVVSKEKKQVSSTQGHQLASTSPFFEKRVILNKEKLKLLKTYLAEKDFSLFGELVEEEALELHAIYMTSHPSLIYLLPGTLALMHMVKQWRAEGLGVYFTLNTGQDIHLLCQQKDAETVQNLLHTLPYVQKVIYNTAAEGAREIHTHLF
jgi:diphosphomevalonate decarboxylase